MMMDGQCPESCNLRGICGWQWVIEADGSAYPCDFYVLDRWRLGNICTDSFEQMEHVRQASGFIDRSKLLPKACLACHWYPLCRNGCYRLRQPEETTNQLKNYFCQAYQNFLSYAYPRLVEIYRKIPLFSGWHTENLMLRIPCVAIERKKAAVDLELSDNCLTKQLPQSIPRQVSLPGPFQVRRWESFSTKEPCRRRRRDIREYYELE